MKRIRRILWFDESAINHEAFIDTLKSSDSEECAADVKKAECALSEARRFAQNARQGLRGHRRSVAWWTKLYELESKISELQLTNNLLRQSLGEVTSDKSVPGQVSSTILSEKLFDAFRIINLDVFQLARSVESASNHVKLLGYQKILQNWRAGTLGETSGVLGEILSDGAGGRVRRVLELGATYLSGANASRSNAADMLHEIDGRFRWDLMEAVSSYVKSVDNRLSRLRSEIAQGAASDVSPSQSGRPHMKQKKGKRKGKKR